MPGPVADKVAFITSAARGQGGADIIAVDICRPVVGKTPIPPSTPDDVAETPGHVLFLVSDESRFITGVASPIDAGIRAK
jgi:(+)-trans-carveol dehydrogenase